MSDVPTDRTRELLVLRHLAGEPDRSVPMTKLADAVQLPIGVTSACVARLEAHGMVRCAMSRTDHEVVYVILLPAGMSACR